MHCMQLHCITSVENTILLLRMTNADLNQVKRRSRLATEEANTYVSMTENAASDTAGNLAVPVVSENATRVSNYTAESTPPQLLTYDMWTSTKGS